VKFLRRFVIRLSNFATGRRAGQRLQEEIAEHLAFQTEENLRAGMSPAEARRQAVLKLGAAEAIREGYHAEQSLPFFENLLFDLNYAGRMLGRSPGFAFVAIATMALGIGATTAIYSVIDATLLHPLPYPNPAELVRIEDDLPGVGAQDVGISVPEWRDLSDGLWRREFATQESVLLREILRRSRTLPGVEEAAVGDVAALPLGHGHDDLNPLPFIREGLNTIEDTKDNQAPVIDGSIVSPEYLHLLGMTLLRGRLFSDQDLEDTPQVAVINQAAARTYWPDQDPLGKRVRLRSQSLANRDLLSSAKPVWTTIVGVIADARTESLADAVIPQIYRSVYQRPAKDLAIFLRGQLDPSAIPAQVREQVQSVDAELPVFHAETLDDVLSTSLSVRRFSMEMVAFFAATALLLAGLGIYGTISYVVNEQRREIAIRLALGAQRANILKMVLRRGLGLAAAGAGLGVAGALIVSHLMAGLLYGVSPTDLLTFAAVTLVLSTVALAASYIPALRAMRLDPITTLHSE
jgi:hypothetical protein